MGDSSNISKGQTPISQILGVAAKFSVPSNRSSETAWKQLPLNKGKQVFFFSKTVSRAAAVVLILALALVSAIRLSQVNITTAKAHRQSIYLPDSSKVILNAESTLSYNVVTWRAKRKVSFEGQGIFEVKKGSSFQVATPDGIIEVLGTRFDVLARPDNFRVACTAGRVMVHTNTQAVVLTPGFNTRKTKTGLSKPHFFDKNILAWEKGEFYFNNAPLASVLEVLQRQYDIEVEIDAQIRRFYTGYFTNTDLDEALQLICVPLGLHYKKLNANKIKIINYEINV